MNFWLIGALVFLSWIVLLLLIVGIFRFRKRNEDQVLNDFMGVASVSNRKKAEKKVDPEPKQEIILTEENKEEVAKILGYSIETVDDILARAAVVGYKKVKLPVPEH